jgi:hypothetical protein
MPELPTIEGLNRLKPLGYDPATGQFITYDQIVTRAARIVPPATLTPQQQAELVAERLRRGPADPMVDLNGRMLSRDQVVEEVVRQTPLGRMLVEADVSYLGDFLRQIETALAEQSG